jgi:hypothetical protein
MVLDKETLEPPQQNCVRNDIDKLVASFDYGM